MGLFRSSTTGTPMLSTQKIEKTLNIVSTWMVKMLYWPSQDCMIKWKALDLTCPTSGMCIWCGLAFSKLICLIFLTFTKPHLKFFRELQFICQSFKLSMKSRWYKYSIDRNIGSWRVDCTVGSISVFIQWFWSQRDWKV